MNLTKFLIENRDTLIESAIYAAKENVPAQFTFFEDEEEAVDVIEAGADEITDMRRKMAHSAESVKYDFSADTLKRYREVLKGLLKSVIYQIADVDRAVESITYWKVEKELEA